jgi:hypothetical protein
MTQPIEDIRAHNKRRKHAKVIANRHAAVEIRTVNAARLTETIAAMSPDGDQRYLLTLPVDGDPETTRNERRGN